MEPSFDQHLDTSNIDEMTESGKALVEGYLKKSGENTDKEMLGSLLHIFLATLFSFETSSSPATATTSGLRQRRNVSFIFQKDVEMTCSNFKKNISPTEQSEHWRHASIRSSEEKVTKEILFRRIFASLMGGTWSVFGSLNEHLFQCWFRLPSKNTFQKLFQLYLCLRFHFPLFFDQHLFFLDFPLSTKFKFFTVSAYLCTPLVSGVRPFFKLEYKLSQITGGIYKHLSVWLRCQRGDKLEWKNKKT